MKTTIDIADSILARVKELAHQEKTSIKALTEEGLQFVLEAHQNRNPSPIQPVIFSGDGLSPAFKGKSWAEIRDEIYRGYG
jgi:hypothetical protein